MKRPSASEPKSDADPPKALSVTTVLTPTTLIVALKLTMAPSELRVNVKAAVAVGDSKEIGVKAAHDPQPLVEQLTGHIAGSS